MLAPDQHVAVDPARLQVLSLPTSTSLNF